MNCLDAETLAAWLDGGLKGAALEDVQTHVAGCERCQMLLGAMGRTRAAVPATEPQRVSKRWLAWAVPLTAAAAAIVIWVAIPQQRDVSVPQAPAPTPSASVSPAAPATVTEAAKPPITAAPSPKAERSDDIAPLTPDATIVESVPAPLAPPPPAEQRGVLAGQVQQRAAAAARDAITFCGPEPPPAAAGQLTASSAPSPDICWIVGNRGVVMRSLDGRTWQRINFPETTDLRSVTATDSSNATVIDSEGRAFRTTDGGVTWMRQ